MIGTPFLSALVGGSLVGGTVSLAAYAWPRRARLEDAVSQLTTRPTQTDANTRTERLGRWAAGFIGTTANTRRLLDLSGRSTSEFVADKVVLALVGAALPAIVTSVWFWLFHTSLWLPAVSAVVGAIAGFFTPNLLLRRTSKRTQQLANESLFTLFDLVILERLANQSVTQAMTSAAALSQAPLFRHVSAALDRARLEQRPPYGELQQLAVELDLPQLGDLVDVIRLEEHGASLARTLRDRLSELRDADLVAMKLAAHERTESMTFFMVIPALIFGLIFIIPPLMQLLGTN